MNVHPKVVAGGVGGALAIVVLYGLGFAIAIPAEVAAAVTLIVAQFCGWLAPWFASVRPGEPEKTPKS